MVKRLVLVCFTNFFILVSTGEKIHNQKHNSMTCYVNRIIT